MPVERKKDDLISFKKVMQINKIMHPRLNTVYLEKRRALYRKQEWDKYSDCVKEAM